MRRQLLCPLACVVTLLSSGAGAQQNLASLSVEALQEAIRLGLNEEASAKFLRPFVLQTKTGMGTSPLLGYCSTPLVRVVLAASNARKEGRSLEAPDVAADLLAPEFQVLLLPQQKAYESSLATINSVTLVNRADGQDRVVCPHQLQGMLRASPPHEPEVDSALSSARPGVLPH
jgi:hypothetical protein